MGNRSIVYFTDGENFSPGIYQQWDGGRCYYWAKQAKLRSGSVEGSAARYLGEACKRTPGNLSVYVYDTPSKRLQNALKDLTDQKNLDLIEKEGPGDNGTYRIMCEQDGSFTVHQISRYFENRKTRKDFTTLDAPNIEYLDKVECRLIGTLPARPDENGSKPKRMPKKEVVSSTVKSIAVSQKSNLLVCFKNNTVYRYYNVSDYTVRNFIEAQSKGKFLNRQIKGSYPYKRLSPGEAKKYLST
jgi:hypothetical protein